MSANTEKNDKQIQHVKVVIQQQDLHRDCTGLSLARSFTQHIQALALQELILKRKYNDYI